MISASQLTQPLAVDPPAELSGPDEFAFGKLIGRRATHNLMVGKSYVIGRHRTADIRIDGNMTVSNRHCSIFQYANMLFLRDTSANGTFVNGKLVGRDCKTLLHHNDHIEIVQNEEYFIYQEYSILRHLRKEREMMLFEKYFLLDKVVGRGSFGLVRIGVNKSTGRRLACKQIKFDCNKIKERQRHHIEQEIAILTKIDHPNLIRVWDIIEVHGCVSIFMDLVEGGDLLGYIESRGNVAEEYARFGFFQLLQALRYLHEINVSHRDLKPENVLVENCSSNYTRLIVTDFGLAKAGLDHTNLKTFCGTMGYIAPEVLTPTADGYTIAVDCWSLGVVLYSMLAGYFPFPDHSDVALTQAVRNGLYDFKAPVWNSVTDPAQDLIAQLIVVDPAARLSVHQALEHPWIADSADELSILYKAYVFDKYQAVKDNIL